MQQGHAAAACGSPAARRSLPSPPPPPSLLYTQQVKRLAMYNNKAKRNKKGKIISQDLQSAELPSTRIRPDRRWFGNTRVIGQKQLEAFREEMGAKVADPYAVLIREKKLPLSLLEDPEKKHGGEAGRGRGCWQLACKQACGELPTTSAHRSTPSPSPLARRQGGARQPGADAAVWGHLWQGRDAQAAQAGRRLVRGAAQRGGEHGGGV